MEGKKIKVLFVAPECAPFVKVGGLADVIGSLPKSLKKLGVDVRIILPKYGTIKEKEWNLKKISFFHLDKEKIAIFQTLLPKSNVIVYFLENKKYFSQKEVYLSSKEFKGFEKFLFFSKAVLEIFQKIKWKPEIIHCNEWETAILIPLLKIKFRNQKSKIKTVLTIHNLSVQGKWNAKDIFQFLNLKGDEIKSLKEKDNDGDFNILQQGILNSDIVTTVSPTYAKEILTKSYGFGLEKELKRKKPVGILNGIDTEVFNPETDTNLKANYSVKNVEKKIENKIELQEILKFEKNEKIPLLGFIGRLTSQKGIVLFEKVIPRLVKKNLQLVFLGVGEKRYEKMLLEFSRIYPKNISAKIEFNPVLAQKIYGGTDIILIPSLFEPCGLIQMIAQRYGTIPVARKTGGLADTIENKKTGFLFKKFSPESFLGAIEKCLLAFQNKKEWQRIVKRAMKKDFSWEKSAKKYLKIYQKLIK